MFMPKLLISIMTYSLENIHGASLLLMMVAGIERRDFQLRTTTVFLVSWFRQYTHSLVICSNIFSQGTPLPHTSQSEVFINPETSYKLQHAICILRLAKTKKSETLPQRCYKVDQEILTR